MGKNVIVDEKGAILAQVEFKEGYIERKFKKGDRVKIKELCNEETVKKIGKRCICLGDWKCNHCKYCNKHAIIEDTEEAGINYQGIPKYGLRNNDKNWLGDFLQDELEADENDL